MTEKKPHKIDQEDPRYHAIQRVEDGTVSVVGTATADILSGGIAQARLFVHFGIPSMPAMCLDQALKSNIASRRTKIRLEPAPNSSNALIPTEHKEFFDAVEHKLVEIIMALTAIEAFANETIPDDMELEVPTKGKVKKMNKVQMERELPLETKLNVVLPKSCGVPSLSKTELWVRFEKLKSLRNRLIHPKAGDRRDQGPADPSVWKDLVASLRDNFAGDAHAIIGHFISPERRWHRLFPTRYPSG
jgi:hypothetical protein